MNQSMNQIMNQTDRSSTEGLDIIDINDDLLGFYGSTKTAKYALNDILIQVYNGTCENTEALNVSSPKFKQQILIYFHCLSLATYFTMDDIAKIYADKIAKTLLTIKNLLNVAKDCKKDEIYIKMSYDKKLIQMYSYGNRCNSSDSDFIRTLYTMEHGYNFVLDFKDKKYDIYLANLFSETGEEMKKIKVKRVNHIDLFFMNNRIYDKICQIFDLLKIEYDKEFYKLFIIPTVHNTDFTNVNDALNYVNYLKLISEI